MGVEEGVFSGLSQIKGGGGVGGCQIYVRDLYFKNTVTITSD